MSRFQSRSGERLHWRALVRTTGVLDASRASQALSWHLVECAEPTQADAHCPVGVHLLSMGADPDGHCLVKGGCPRCAAASVAVPASDIPAATAVLPDSPLELSSQSVADLPVSPSAS